MNAMLCWALEASRRKPQRERLGERAKVHVPAVNIEMKVVMMQCGGKSKEREWG